MPIFPVRRKLPTAYSTEIGRLITRWAWLEWELKCVAYAILQLGPKEGRLSVREPRAHDYLTMIEDLMRVRGLSASASLKPYLKPAKAKLIELGDLRNAVAHGIWIKHEGTHLPTLQLVSGSLLQSIKWPHPLQKAKIEPRALAVELPGLRAAVSDTEQLTKMIQALRREIEEQLSASPGRPVPPHRKTAVRHSRNRAARKNPPRSSRA